ncbi:MAG: hypothetical protein AB7F19_06450 [Candidatus Babeliales bacterium]
MKIIGYISLVISLMVSPLFGMELDGRGKDERRSIQFLDQAAYVNGSLINSETSRAIETWKKAEDKLTDLEERQNNKPVISRLASLGFPSAVVLLHNLFPNGVPLWDVQGQWVAGAILVGGLAASFWGLSKADEVKKVEELETKTMSTDLPALRQVFQQLKPDARVDASNLLLLHAKSYKDWDKVRSALDVNNNNND